MSITKLDAFKNTLNEKINKYIEKYYGDIPRYRGCSFMKTEEEAEYDEYSGNDTEMFNKYVGQDVIEICTRCGGVDGGKEENYRYCGADKWEEEHKDLFLDHVDEEFDCTYCNHYFKAVKNDEYYDILKQMSN